MQRSNDIKTKNMIKTTSLKHYKKLKEKGLQVQLVTKQDLKK
jgi:hypothetical protein